MGAPADTISQMTTNRLPTLKEVCTALCHSTGECGNKEASLGETWTSLAEMDSLHRQESKSFQDFCGSDISPFRG